MKRWPNREGKLEGPLGRIGGNSQLRISNDLGVKVQLRLREPGVLPGKEEIAVHNMFRNTFPRVKLPPKRQSMVMLQLRWLKILNQLGPKPSKRETPSLEDKTDPIVEANTQVVKISTNRTQLVDPLNTSKSIVPSPRVGLLNPSPKRKRTYTP